MALASRRARRGEVETKTAKATSSATTCRGSTLAKAWAAAARERAKQRIKSVTRPLMSFVGEHLMP